MYGNYTFQPITYVQGATYILTPNHTDPYYTDVCYEITREMCDFCCLRDFEFCSRDIGICEPVEDRNLSIIVDCVMILGGILCGFPIIINLCGCLISTRCCSSLFPVTNGVSCYELTMRMCCYLVCVHFNTYHKKNQDDVNLEGDQEKKGMCYKLFYYMFCCFLFPCLFKKRRNGGAEGDEAADGE